MGNSAFALETWLCQIVRGWGDGGLVGQATARHPLITLNKGGTRGQKGRRMEKAARAAKRRSKHQPPLAGRSGKEVGRDPGHGPAATASADREEIEFPWQLRWGVAVSVRYSSKMARRYENLENLQALIGLVSGTGVVVSTLQNSPVFALALGAAAAVMPLAALIFKWREKATFFAGRSEAYQRLKLDIELNRRPREDVIAERAQLEMQEGEPSHTLWRISANEEARVLGVAGHPLTWGQKIVAVACYGIVPAQAPRQLPAREASASAQ